jgi:Arc/MetJ-type ribon-helix-helix transcriptional regulator
MAKPLQVYLEDSDLESLEKWARARGWTKSQVVRAALRALTRPKDEDPLLAASGMIADDGLPPDVSERFDEYLDHTFVAERSPRYARRTRRRVRR